MRLISYLVVALFFGFVGFVDFGDGSDSNAIHNIAAYTQFYWAKALKVAKNDPLSPFAGFIAVHQRSYRYAVCNN